jgi:hypothetical protein
MAGARGSISEQTGEGRRTLSGEPAVTVVFQWLRDRVTTGPAITRAAFAVAVVFGGLSLLDSFGSRFALPLAVLIFAGVLIRQGAS